MTIKPTIFIASSKEGLSYAQAAKANLDNVGDCIIWKQDVFKPSSYPLIDLENMLQRSHYGVFICTYDDIAIIRENEYSVIRDNIILELGLFIGKLGRDRCFILMPVTIDKSHIPSDLTGINVGFYDTNRYGNNLKAMLGDATFDIQNQIETIEINAADNDKKQLQLLSEKIVSRDIMNFEKKLHLDDTMYTAIPIILELIARQKHYKEIKRAVTITPRLDGKEFEMRSYTESILYSVDDVYTFSTTWYESVANQRSIKYTKFIIDGIDFTEQVNESIEYIERDEDDHYNCWGVKSPPIPFPNDNGVHNIVSEIRSVKKVYGIYCSSGTQSVPVKKFELSILLSGEEASKWVIEYNSFSAFYFSKSPIHKQYRSKYHTLQNVQINYDDWLIPGGGFMYVVRPRQTGDERKLLENEVALDLS